jgi:hypothetical protein
MSQVILPTTAQWLSATLVSFRVQRSLRGPRLNKNWRHRGDTVGLLFGGACRKPAYLLAAPQGFEPRYADPESANRTF